MSKIKKLYLAHPYDSRYTVRVWEEKVEEQFGIELVNPFYDTDREDVQAVDAGRKKRYQVEHYDIVNGDVDLISDAQGIVAVIDGSFSIGTIMEIVYSYKVFGKQTYIIVTTGHEKHPWIQFHSDKVFTSFEDFEKFLEANSKED